MKMTIFHQARQYSERNLAYKPLLNWTDLDRVYEANQKTSEALGRHSETKYTKNRELMF